MPHSVRRAQRKPLLLRSAVVAATSTAAALLTLVPATADPAAPAAVQSAPAAQSAPAVQEAAVQNVAFAAPTLSPAAVRAAALQAALGKLGSPYRYGASGPSAFDCSGLTSWAFKQAGVTIPRTSRAQSTFGTPVSRADLQPGDLVFFYKPVSHVAIYIGNGQVVHASTSGQPVKIANLSAMPFSGARRV